MGGAGPTPRSGPVRSGPVQQTSSSLELFTGPQEGPRVEAASVDPEGLDPDRFWFSPGLYSEVFALKFR